MAVATIHVFNPVPAAETFAYVIAAILENGQQVTGREYDPENFISHQEMCDHIVEWLRQQGVTEATVTFVSLKTSQQTGEEMTEQVGPEHAFNPQNDGLDLGRLVSQL